jgi:hypothetical protein
VVLDAVEHAAGVLLDGGDVDVARRLLAGAATVRDRDGHPWAAQRRARCEADRTAAGVGRSAEEPVVAPDLAWLLTLASDALG